MLGEEHTAGWKAEQEGLIKARGLITGAGNLRALERSANGGEGAGPVGAAILHRFGQAFAHGGGTGGLGLGDGILAGLGDTIEGGAAGIDGAAARGLGGGIGGRGDGSRIGRGATRIGHRGRGAGRRHRIGGHGGHSRSRGEGHGLRFGFFALASGERQRGQGQNTSGERCSIHGQCFSELFHGGLESCLKHA